MGVVGKGGEEVNEEKVCVCVCGHGEGCVRLLNKLNKRA